MCRGKLKSAVECGSGNGQVACERRVLLLFEPAHWTARQSVARRAAGGEQVLDLVGLLQGTGLVVTDLGWQVSPTRLSRLDSPLPSKR